MYRLLVAATLCVSSILLLLFLIDGEVSERSASKHLPALETLKSVSLSNGGKKMIFESTDPRVLPGTLKKFYAALKGIESSEVLAHSDFEKYGMTSSGDVITYSFENHEPVFLQFGSLNEYIGKRYVLFSKHEIHAVPDELLELFSEEVDSLYSKRVFFLQTEEILEVQVTLGAGKPVSILGGQQEGWLVNGKSADPIFLGAFLRDISDLTYLERFPRSELPEGVSGLFPPQANVRVTWEADGKRQVRTLSLGNEVLREKKLIGYYASLDKADMIMILPSHAYRRLVPREENLIGE